MAYQSRINMPSNHHKDDAKWLESQLMLLSPIHQIHARAAYSDVYQTQYMNESATHKKLNRARREANIRMRKFVTACLESYEQERVVAANESHSNAGNSNFEWQVFLTIKLDNPKTIVNYTHKKLIQDKSK